MLKYEKILEKRYLSTIDQIYLVSINAKINEAENMLDAKAKFKSLEPLDEYGIDELNLFFE